MALAVPITNGHMSGDALTFSAGGDVGAGVGAGGPIGSAADVQGTGNLGGPHNTPLHVASILAIAGGIVIGLHYLGFRFGFDVGAGR